MLTKCKPAHTFEKIFNFFHSRKAKTQKRAWLFAVYNYHLVSHLDYLVINRWNDSEFWIFGNSDNIPDMKFDCIIMNPPYEKNLHLKILAEAITHLKDEKSKAVNLSPSTWASKYNICQPKGKWRNTFNGKIDSLYFIPHDEANRLFGTGNSIEDLLITTYKINGNFNILKYGFNSEVEYSLFKKINIFSDNKNIMTVRQACNNGAYGTGNDTKNIVRKEFDVPIYQWHGGKTCRDAVVIKDNSRKASLAFYFNSANERQNFLNSLDTKFMNWYYMNFIVPGDYKIVAYMFRMADYSQPWTDKRFCEFFNIAEDEQKIIEDTMAKYK